MPDLAAVSTVAAQQLATGDDTTADADVAMQVHEILAAGSGTAQVFRERTETGLVTHRDGKAEAQSAHEVLAELLVLPAEVGGSADEAVGSAHHPADGGGHADAVGAVPCCAHHFQRGAGEDLGHLAGVATAGKHGDLPVVEEDPAQADAGGGQPVHAHVEGEDVHAVGLGPHDQGRPARPAGLAGQFLTDQAGRAQLAHQTQDGAAVESHALGQDGPRHGSADVHMTEQGAEVVPANLLLRGTGFHGTPDLIVVRPGDGTAHPRLRPPAEPNP